MTSPGEGFHIASAFVEITGDRSKLDREIDNLPNTTRVSTERAGKGMGDKLVDGMSKGVTEGVRRKVSPKMGDTGRGLGDKLSEGLRMSMVRNSPVIVAAIGAGLAAGAPVMLASATALFAGVGIVAAAQSQAVQSAWVGTWDRIKAGSIESASAIEPVLIRVADNVGDAFERMGPRITEGFEAAAPQIEVFADGVLGLAENALPGLVRAVENGMVVTQGLASFMESTGTGLSDFFDRITVHAPAAGQAFTDLGGTMETLLPLLGELLGQGVELATLGLPLLNGSLGLVLDVATLLGPALPILAAGFLGLKVANTAAGWVGSLGGRLTDFASKGGMAAGAAGRVGGALGAIGGAAGPVGLLIGVVTMAMAHGEQQADEYARAMLEGGAATEAVMAEAAKGDIIEALTGHLGGLGATVSLWTTNTEEATQAHKDLLAQMTPQARAAAELSMAEGDLATALDRHGEGSREVAEAQAAYDAALAESERVNGELEDAINGVTEAMLNQADQALASIDAGFAHRQAQLQTRDAMESLRTTMEDSKATADDVAAATLNVEQALFREATAAAEAKVSVSDLKAGTDEYNRMVQVETLAALKAMRDGLDPQMQAAVDSMIATLERGGVSLDELGAKEVTPTVDLNDLPLIGKTDNAFSLLDMLAGKTPVPFADLEDYALVGATQTDMGLLDVLGDQRPTPVSALNNAAFMAQYGSAMNVLGVLSGQRPMPWAFLNTSPLDASWRSTMNVLGILSGQRPSPIATLYADTWGAENALNRAARNRTSYVTQVVSQVAASGAALFRATGGSIGDAPIEKFAVGGSPGGKVRGPGSITSDGVGPFLTNRAMAYLSDQEWIIKALSANGYGDERMAAVNAGTATVLLPEETAGSVSMPSTGGGSSGGTAMATRTEVRDLHVHVRGVLDLRDRSGMRTLGVELRKVLDGIEREER